MMTLEFWYYKHPFPCRRKQHIKLNFSFTDIVVTFNLTDA